MTELSIWLIDWPGEKWPDIDSYRASIYPLKIHSVRHKTKENALAEVFDKILDIIRKRYGDKLPDDFKLIMKEKTPRDYRVTASHEQFLKGLNVS